jgi:hypothetical protein
LVVGEAVGIEGENRWRTVAGLGDYQKCALRRCNGGFRQSVAWRCFGSIGRVRASARSTMFSSVTTTSRAGASASATTMMRRASWCPAGPDRGVRRPAEPLHPSRRLLTCLE